MTIENAHVHTWRCTREVCGWALYYCAGGDCMRVFDPDGTSQRCEGHQVPSRAELIAERKG